MKRLILPLLFLATPAMAQPASPPQQFSPQQPPPQQQMQQQLDSMVAGVTRVMTTLTGQIANDQMQQEQLMQKLQALQKQVDTLTAEKADLEKKVAPETKTP